MKAYWKTWNNLHWSAQVSAKQFRKMARMLGRKPRAMKVRLTRNKVGTSISAEVFEAVMRYKPQAWPAMIILDLE